MSDCLQLLQWITDWLYLPQNVLPLLFVVSLLAATILPLGSEPLFVTTLIINPDNLWLILIVATIGNSLGGMINFGLGLSGNKCWLARKAQSAKKTLDKSKYQNLQKWLITHGAKVCFFAWLPIIGDAICLVAGWLGLIFWQFCFYLVLGKFFRYGLLAFIVFL